MVEKIVINNKKKFYIIYMKMLNEDRGDKNITRETKRFNITKKVDRDENGKLISRERIKTRKGENMPTDDKNIKMDDMANKSGVDSTTTSQGTDAQHNIGGGGYSDGSHPDTPKDIKPPKPTKPAPPKPKDPAPTEPAPTAPTEPAPTAPTPDAPTDSVNPDGLGWFASNWKTIAIVAGAAAIIAGIAALIKGLNKTIKVRYNKAVRTLQRAQKDFTMEERGLDMANVMPGVGSRIFDKIAGLWNKGSKKASANGNIGLHPFCNQYKEEINADLRQAQEAFSKIKLASDEMEEGLDKEANANNPENSSVNTKVFDSFREALNSDVLNESEKLDEIGAMAAISTAMTLGGLAVKAGKFLISKFKNGKPDGEGKVVQVTKQSTREICEAIIMNYGNKYINMQQVFSDCGISSESLADLDMASADKLGEILKKYKKPENNKITNKQYSRIENKYRTMLKHYYNIGDGIIKNFVKYTKAENEKDENLLTAASEKLQNMWDSQKDFYDNNFSRIVVEIVSSYSAIAYNDFIVEKVIPVFKTGLAGDADYVLDAMPKKGEFYVLRQTEGQPWMKEQGEKQMGNTAIAEVTGFDKDKNELTFKLIARMENDGNISIDDRGIASVEGDINFDFYADGDGNVAEQTLAYGKWLALDPALTEWRPTDSASSVMEYSDKKGNKYVIYGSKDIRNKEEGYDKIYFCVIKSGMSKVSVVNVINLASNITVDGFNGIFSKLNFDFKENSDEAYVKDIQKGVNGFTGKVSETKADSADKAVEVINKFLSKEGTDVDVIYGMENESDQVFVFGTTNNKESINGAYIVLKSKESAGLSEVVKVNIEPALLKDAFSKMFANYTPKFGQCGEEYSKIASEAMSKKDAKSESVSNSAGLSELMKKYTKDDMKPIGNGANGNGDKKIMDQPLMAEIKTLATVISSCIGFGPVQNQSGTSTGANGTTQPNAAGQPNTAGQTNGTTNGATQPNTTGQTNGTTNGATQPNTAGQTNGTTQESLNEDGDVNNGMFQLLNMPKDENVVKAKGSIQNGNGSVTFEAQRIKITTPGDATKWQFLYVTFVVKDNKCMAELFDAKTVDTAYEVRPNDVMIGKDNVNNIINIINACITKYQRSELGTASKIEDIETWKKLDTQQNSSVKVSYSHKVMNEGVSTNTVITRQFKNFPKNAYVLSESYFDLGRDTSKLSNSVYTKKLKTRSQVFDYVKSNLDAKIFNLTESQTYKVSSFTGYRPSLMTPLYENVYIVKFNDDDVVSSMKYLGKFKIQ